MAAFGSSDPIQNNSAIQKISLLSTFKSTQLISKLMVVKMLVVVVALFATLWFPYRFLVVYNSFATHRYMELWFFKFCKTMIFINSAINPILYNAMSNKFRKAFKRLLSCGKPDINHAPS
ncbi:thyrotropin-releasing hormone receptor [Caerostris darwini]|uniref:Thyrotropin-releasing hormone receptor n=1 Tax=Caerostris darwini TaxID=1538125 RepID=A0AAV4Q4F8_9ARAC|nr:thyrotropin-releasing hormone receptor [Caerostris darwini]